MKIQSVSIWFVYIVFIFSFNSDALVDFNAQFGAVNDEEIYVYNFEMHSSEISKLWNRVQETSKNSDKADIVVADSKYDDSYNVYMECLVAINRKLAQLRNLKLSSS